VAEGKLTGAEIGVERWRTTTGLVLGPPVFLLLLLLPFPDLSPAAHKLLAVLGLVITFWVTQPIPIPLF
jgi:sodium-dependent dicarboxylate transporter 2/3/5